MKIQIGIERRHRLTRRQTEYRKTYKENDRDQNVTSCFDRFHKRSARLPILDKGKPERQRFSLNDSFFTPSKTKERLTASLTLFIVRAEVQLYSGREAEMRIAPNTQTATKEINALSKSLLSLDIFFLKTCSSSNQFNDSTVEYFFNIFDKIQ